MADAGPPIAFARLGRLALLPQLFAQVLVTEEVFAECTCRPDYDEARPILEAVQQIKLGLTLRSPYFFIHLQIRHQ